MSFWLQALLDLSYLQDLFCLLLSCGQEILLEKLCVWQCRAGRSHGTLGSYSTQVGTKPAAHSRPSCLHAQGPGPSCDAAEYLVLVMCFHVSALLHAPKGMFYRLSRAFYDTRLQTGEVLVCFCRKVMESFKYLNNDPVV